MYWLFIVLFLLFAWRVHQNTLFIANSLSDYFIKLFLGFVSAIIPIGFLLSWLNLINQAWAWGIGVNLMAWLFYIVFKKIADNQSLSLNNILSNAFQSFDKAWHSLNLAAKITFAILAFGVVLTSLANLIISFVSYPNEWDSMTGHLVKCAYYLQNGNMNRIQGTTWTIDYYPNSLPTIQIFFYHLLGEKGFKLIHYFSYWIFALSTYNIAKKISPTKKNQVNFAAVFVFLITALLPTALVQATTTESDIVLTAYLGILAYLMFSFKEKPSKLNLLLIALMSGVWIGHKVTFMLIAPAALLVAIYTVLNKQEFYKNIVLFAFTFVLSIAIYVLPTGYIGNLKEAKKMSLGSLSAPAEVMNWHGVEHYSTQDKIKNFELNILRYTSDFLHFDGIRNTTEGKRFDDKFRLVPNKIFNKFHLEGEHFTVVSGFWFNQKIPFYIERPYWGIISFGLVLPLIFLVFVSFRKYEKTLAPTVILVAASAIHFLSLCYSAPYDPIKSRYFMNMAIWTLPILVNVYKNRSKFFHIYILFAAIIVSISGILTVLFTNLHPIFKEKNIFNISRVEQLTISRPEITAAYQKFDEIVPADAIVALGTQQEHEDFEYPLWGKDFKRKLIPLHPFRSAVKPIPENAQYLFYSKGVIPHKEGDLPLGTSIKRNDTAVEESEFYLRKLK